MERSHEYDDIIDLPHHQSQRRAHMSARDRAAQFAPFAALVGHDAAIRETARLTDTPVELGEDEKQHLDAVLRQLRERMKERPEVTVCYFEPDPLKPGGCYLERTGHVLKIDCLNGVLYFEEGGIVFIELIRWLKLT